MDKETLKGIQDNVARAEKSLDQARQAITDARSAKVDPDTIAAMESRYNETAARVRSMKRVYGSDNKTAGA